MLQMLLNDLNLYWTWKKKSEYIIFLSFLSEYVFARCVKGVSVDACHTYCALGSLTWLWVNVQMCVCVNECVFVCQENAVRQVMWVSIPLSWYRIPSQHASACVPGSGLSKPGARVMERSHYGACRPGFHPCSTADAPPLEASGPHNVVQM